MALRNSWLPDGFRADTFGQILQATALNPFLTVPLLLVARYTAAGRQISSQHLTTLARLQTLCLVGIVRRLSSVLSHRVQNNWETDAYDWKKEIVIVTGGAGGIGGSIVSQLAAHDVTVVVLDILPLSYDAPPTVHYYKCDISTPSELARVASAVREEVGEPTVLINNAGVARGRPVLEATEQDVRFVFDVNTLAHYWMAQEFVPAMVRRNHGMVVTVSSIAAYVTMPRMTDYAGSKAATLAFHEGLTAELASLHHAAKVRTVLVTPGPTGTSLFDGYHNQSEFLIPTLRPSQVAAAVVRKVLSGTSGQVMIPGGANVLLWLRALPTWLQVRLRNNGSSIMTNWRGRQVVDPAEHFAAKNRGR